VGEAFQIIFELAVILAESVAGEKRETMKAGRVFSFHSRQFALAEN
jgi:hypothetical protein